MKGKQNNLKSVDNLDDFSVVFFFFNILFLLYEKKAILNTINGLELFYRSLFVGAIIASIFLVILNYKNPLFYSQSKRKLILNFQIFMSIAFFTATTTNLINCKLADDILICKNYSIQKINYETGNGRHYSNAKIDLKLENNQNQTFEIDIDLYLQLLGTGEIKLCKRKGIFGYDYVTRFESK